MSPAKPSKPKAVKPAAPEIPTEAVPLVEAAPIVVETPPQPAPAQVAPPQPVPAQPAPTTPPDAPAAADLNQPGFPLHPERIWPD